MMRKKHIVEVGNVKIGGEYPVVVQSMTNSDTENAIATAEQIIELYNAGSEIVRITVNTETAAKNITKIQNYLVQRGFENIPIVGDFHYNGHLLLQKYPEMAQILAKYRINPGNVGFGKKRDNQFEIMIEQAIKYNKPVRIGVNWGSLDKYLSAKLMDKNKNSKNPLSSTEILKKSLIESALISSKKAEEIGLAKNKIILSCKVSEVPDLIDIYQKLDKLCDYPLHLGLTEAGIGSKGIVASAVALGILLKQNIGNTIRVSITPLSTEPRTKEVNICQEIIQVMGIRAFKPLVTSCPGCGRTSSVFFQELAENIQNFIEEEMPIWKKEYPKAKDVKIAVMGCIVNGPGESKYANIGISLPGNGEDPSAPVFIDGKKATTLKGKNISKDFRNIIKDYIKNL